LAAGYSFFTGAGMTPISPQPSIAPSIPSARIDLPAQPPFKHPIEPFPDDNELGTYRSGLAPLNVTASTGKFGYFFAVTAEDGTKIETFFVGPGQSLQTLVPMGKLNVQCVCGTVWYGDTYLFGPNALHNELSLPFSENFYGYQGYAISVGVDTLGDSILESAEKAFSSIEVCITD
jgi:hypothetical protein